MSTLHRLGAGLLALTFLGGAAACGSDDDASPTTTTAGQGALTAELDEFCEALVDFNSAVFAVEIEDDTPKEDLVAAGTDLAPLSQALEDGAPAALSDAASEINAAVQPLTDGDATAFNDDAVFETYTGFVSGAIDECAFESVAVTAVDYAFEDAPDTLPAGTVSIDLTNASEAEDHELVLIAKADGVDLTWDELLALPEEEAMTKTSFVGATFAPPGEDGALLAELEPGSYAMLCFIPVGGGEDGPPHFTQGMLHELTVE